MRFTGGLKAKHWQFPKAENSYGSPSTPGRHVSRLCIFEEVVQRGHVGDGQPFHAVEKASLKDIGLEKCPGRIQHELRPSYFSSFIHQLLGRKSCIAVHGL